MDKKVAGVAIKSPNPSAIHRIPLLKISKIANLRKAANGYAVGVLVKFEK